MDRQLRQLAVSGTTRAALAQIPSPHAIHRAIDLNRAAHAASIEAESIWARWARTAKPGERPPIEYVQARARVIEQQAALHRELGQAAEEIVLTESRLRRTEDELRETEAREERRITDGLTVRKAKAGLELLEQDVEAALDREAGAKEGSRRVAVAGARR